MLEKELRKILQAEAGERAVSKFLAKHPQLVRWAFCTTAGHSTYVLKEFPFGSRFKADFVIPISFSAGWVVHLIELEPPNDSVITKKGTPSRRLNTAATQVRQWEDYIVKNPVSFRKDLSDWCVKRDLLGENEGDGAPCNLASDYLHDPETHMDLQFHIVIGQRERISRDQRHVMNTLFKDIELCTFGRFLDVAANHDRDEERA